jgi:hypothetical protein
MCKYTTFRVGLHPSYLFNTTIMPPQRTPLYAISSNRPRGKDISPYIHRKIVGMADGSTPASKIQAQYRVSRKAVRGSIAQDSQRPEGKSVPHSGCPPTYTDRDKRMMLRNLRLFPKSTFDDRRLESGIEMSNTTIKRLARKHGLHY